MARCTASRISGALSVRFTVAILLFGCFADHSTSLAVAITNGTVVDEDSSYHQWTLEAWSLAQVAADAEPLAPIEAGLMYERRLAGKMNPFARGSHASKNAPTHAAAPGGVLEGAYPPVLPERAVPSVNAEAALAINANGVDSASAARIYAPPWWLRREVQIRMRRRIEVLRGAYLISLRGLQYLYGQLFILCHLLTSFLNTLLLHFLTGHIRQERVGIWTLLTVHNSKLGRSPRPYCPLVRLKLNISVAVLRRLLVKFCVRLII